MVMLENKNVNMKFSNVYKWSLQHPCHSYITKYYPLWYRMMRFFIIFFSFVFDICNSISNHSIYCHSTSAINHTPILRGRATYIHTYRRMLKFTSVRLTSLTHTYTTVPLKLNNNDTQFTAVAHMPSTTHQVEQHTFIHIKEYWVSGSLSNTHLCHCAFQTQQHLPDPQLRTETGMSHHHIILICAFSRCWQCNP